MFLLSCWVQCVQKKLQKGLDKMNKLIMAFTLLLTPFFSLKSLANEPDSVSPQSSQIFAYIGGNSVLDAVFIGQSLSPSEACNYLFDNGGFGNVSTHTNEGLDIIVDTDTYKKFDCKIKQTVDNPTDYVQLLTQRLSYADTSNKFCPPDANPDYIYGVDNDDDGQPDICYKENPALEQCPQGNYKYKLAGGCVPIDCGSSGQQKTMWSSGSVYTNTAGTYCDGSCAFSVLGGQNPYNHEGNIGITGFSTGDICGQGHPDDRWHNEGDGTDCVSQDGFLSCPNGDTEDSPHNPQPTIDLEPEKVTLEEITPLIPVEETCATGDASCEIRNLKETIVTKGLEQKEIDKLLHNKKITADEKSSTKVIDGLKESAGRNAEGLALVTAAIDGLKGSIGGGGGGGGSLDGDVVCDSEGNCEGGIETDIEPSDGLVGYWESEYENGLQGIMDEKFLDVQSTEFFTFLDQFNPSISGGSAPSYQMCFNIGSLGNFGCHDFNIDPRTFPAIRIFILVSAGFLCRRILFGG